MRKITKTILLFDLLAGMLFMGFYGMRSRAVVTDSGIVRVAEEEMLQEADVKKIAITFDDEVIIGLSQEICCIEAISLI